ncbi:hypothetical protein AAC387_Pa09g1563 [Persea americana]
MEQLKKQLRDPSPLNFSVSSAWPCSPYSAASSTWIIGFLPGGSSLRVVWRIPDWSFLDREEQSVICLKGSGFGTRVIRSITREIVSSWMMDFGVQRTEGMIVST